jgi:hypothetical protein
MKSIVSKMLLVSVALAWVFLSRAKADFPQTCTNPQMYGQCINDCFSQIGQCFEYCPPSDCMGACSIMEWYDNVYDSNGNYEYTVTNFMGSYPPGSCQAYCVNGATSCASNCAASYCN